MVYCYDSRWRKSNRDNEPLADFHLKTIGFVFQDDHLFPRSMSAGARRRALVLATG